MERVVTETNEAERLRKALDALKRIAEPIDLPPAGADAGRHYAAQIVQRVEIARAALRQAAPSWRSSEPVTSGHPDDGGQHG